MKSKFEISTKKVLRFASFSICLVCFLASFLLQASLAGPKPTEKKKTKFAHAPFFAGFPTVEDGDYAKALKRVDELIRQNRGIPLFPHLKALILVQSGDANGGIAIYRQLIKRQIATKQRFARPYLDLAHAYEETSPDKKLPQLLEEILLRFPDNLKAVREVESINRRLKDKKVASIIQSAIKKHVSGAYKTNRTLERVKPVSPHTLKPGDCYQMLMATKCFPKFRMFVTYDRCVADSGIARYLISPSDYNKIILFDPESMRYVSTSIVELMKNHCGKSEADAPYSRVERKGTSTLFKTHRCTVYKCTHLGDDNFDIVYLSDSLKITDALIKPMSQMYQIPLMGCVPMKIVRYMEGYPYPVLTVYSIKQVKLEQAVFSLPKTAKRVKSINDVMLDNDILDTIFK